MAFSLTGSVGKSSSETESTTEGTKESTTKQQTSGTTSQTTSGSVNTSDIVSGSNQTTSGRTDVSEILGTTGSSTSGRTDTSMTSGSTNVSSTDASQNVQTSSGSVNTILNSGSKNVTTQGPRTSTSVRSGSVNTSQLLLSQEAVDYQVRQILEGPSGLAATVRGSNIAGVYNDTSRTLLASDLIARTAGEVAARGAITQQIIGGSTDTTFDTGFDTTQIIGGSSTTQNIGGATTITDIGATRGTQQIGGATSTTQIGATTSKGTTSQTGTTNVGGTTTTGGTTQSGVQTIGGTTTSGTSSSISFGESLDTILSNTFSSGKETQKKGGVGWIICTELLVQGRMPLKYYVHGKKVFDSYKDQDKCGYYIWAIPCVRHLRKYPNSLFSRILEKVFVSRAAHITETSKPGKGKHSVLGFLATHGLFIFSWILAKTIAKGFIPKSPEEQDMQKLKGASNAS